MDNQLTTITRSEAKAQGLKRYYTGKPCKHGHVAERFVGNKVCAECSKAQCKEKHASNKELYNQKAREYSQQNREAERQRLVKWRAENPDKSRAGAMNYWLANTEQCKANRRARYQKDPAPFIAAARARGLKVNSLWNALSNAEKAEVSAIYKQCQQLNAEAGYIAYHVDHIHPLAKGGAHHPDNLQILSAQENLSKGAKV